MLRVQGKHLLHKRQRFLIVSFQFIAPADAVQNPRIIRHILERFPEILNGLVVLSALHQNRGVAKQPGNIFPAVRHGRFQGFLRLRQTGKVCKDQPPAVIHLAPLILFHIGSIAPSFFFQYI